MIEFVLLLLAGAGVLGVVAKPEPQRDRVPVKVNRTTRPGRNHR